MSPKCDHTPLILHGQLYEHASRGNTMNIPTFSLLFAAQFLHVLLVIFYNFFLLVVITPCVMCKRGRVIGLFVQISVCLSVCQWHKNEDFERTRPEYELLQHMGQKNVYLTIQNDLRRAQKSCVFDFLENSFYLWRPFPKKIITIGSVRY